MWDIHDPILHHHWILKTGYEQFFPFPFFWSILERAPSQFDQVGILRLFFQYKLLPESIDFKAKPNP